MSSDPRLNWLAVRSDGLAFVDCVYAAASEQELVEQFDRLCGTNLCRKGSPIELMVDDATKRNEGEMRLFAEFVWEFVFLRVPDLSTKQ